MTDPIRDAASKQQQKITTCISSKVQSLHVGESHGPTGLPNAQANLGRCFLIRWAMIIRNALRFAANGAQSGQFGFTQPFDKFPVAGLDKTRHS